jgi:glutathione-regulated potassium-efflux system ancillary protein KefF
MGSLMLLVVFAHPYPERSRANLALLEGVRGMRDLELRSLYDLYPDFDIDVSAEQEALTRAQVVVWQHPIYWYAPPGLLKHWFDKVLLRGWAYGEGGNALRGKRCLWVTTTGGEPAAYGPGGMHRLPFPDFVPPIEQTARFCQMSWEEPLILHGSHKQSDDALRDVARQYRERLERLRSEITEAS